MNLTKKTAKPLDNYTDKKDRSLLFLTFAVLAFFAGLILTISLYNYTFIDVYTLSKFFIGFTIIGFIIPLKYYTKWFHFVKYEMIIFNVLGIGPLLTGLFLVLNFTFSNNSFTHQYRIEKIYFEGESNYESVGVVLEQNFFSDERKIVELTNPNPQEIMRKKFMKITIAKGLFGFDVIKSKVLIE